MSRRSRAEEIVQARLAAVQGPWLPMPCPDNAAKLSLEEWMEYRHRCIRHREQFPDYDAGWHRPTPETAEAVWNLLGLNLDALLPPMPRSWDLTLHEHQELALTIKQALVVVLDRVLRAGQRRRTLTLNHVFDALAEKWSDHFRRALEEGPATRVRDMRQKTASDSWRDLLRAGINFKTLWRVAVVASSAQSRGNPLYYVQRLEGSGYQVIVTESPTLEQFVALVRKDPSYRRRDLGWRFLTRADPLPPRETRQEVCAERPYNVVRLGPRSDRLLAVQQEARLIFNVVAFREDYRAAIEATKRIQKELEPYGVDPETSDYRPPRRNEKRPFYVPSKREKQIRRVPKEQRPAVYDLVAKYDRFRGLTANFREVWNQLPPEHPTSEELVAWIRPFAERLLDDVNLGLHWPFTSRFPIKSGFVRLINRRYQPTHFWPLSVSPKPWKEDWEEDEDIEPSVPDSFRERWFQYGGLPWEEDNYDVPHLKLVGLDISSSQTQILAAFVGLKDLEEVASSPTPFKAYLAEHAWWKHCDPNDPFTLEKGYHAKDDYRDPKDERLIELVKSLWMRVLYGSEIRQVVRDHQKDGSTYGPGWSEENANRLLESLPWYRDVKHFLDACRHLVKIACQADPYRGVVFIDPFDGAEVRWNPVQRGEVPLSRDGQKLYLSLPGRWVTPPGGRKKFQEGGRNDEGDYPVDRDRLRRMVAPCLVQMLDAYFSSLVLERLTADHRDVVGIHDGWYMFVSHDAVERAETFIKKVIYDAGKEWFEGLGPIYDRLADYLDSDRTFGPFVRQWREAWEARVQEKRWPHFAAPAIRPLSGP